MHAAFGAPKALEGPKIESTLRRLHKRVSERFPKSGLASVCNELVQIAQQTAERAQKLARPYLGVRLAVLILVLAGIGAQIAAARYFKANTLAMEATSLLQGLEAGQSICSSCSARPFGSSCPWRSA